MTKNGNPELFILLLNEAVEADRMARRVIRATQNKSHARHFFQLCQSDLEHIMSLRESIDTIEQMGANS